MLWFQLLQNTICCGKLYFTSHRLKSAKWSSFVNYKQKIEGKRPNLKNLDLCSFHCLATAYVPVLKTALALATDKRQGGGLVWVVLLLP